MEASDLQQQQRQVNSGLMRYQSAPSSFFSNLSECEEFLNRPASPETERFFARFLAKESQNLVQIKQESAVRETQFPSSTYTSLNNNDDDNITRLGQQQNNYAASASLGFNQNQLKPPLPKPKSGSGSDYGLPPMKTGGSNSSLVRHSSTPAGFLSNINVEFENGLAVLRGMEDYRPPLSPTRISAIAEVRNKDMGENSPYDAGFGEPCSGNYVTGYPAGSWDDSSMLSGPGGLTDDDRTLSGGLNDLDAGKPPRMLAHHLSLPKTAIEKLLQLQESVPCKIRAKRGFATHPRSIAERVRRTKISERMRKLQDLVPNMDKQTNTAGMLDFAVDYIKDLQRQVKILSEDRAKCTCRSSQRP